MFSNTTAAVLPPGDISPRTTVPVPHILRPGPKEYDRHTTAEEVIAGYKDDPNFKPPSYLTQYEDYFPLKEETKTMGPIGSWATGHLYHSNFDGVTGTQPVVDRYSITRFSEGQWRKNNQELLKTSEVARVNTEISEWDGLKSIDSVMASSKKDQDDNTGRLKQRQREVYRWKAELRMAAVAVTEEMNLLAVQRQRLQKAMEIILIPSSIAAECLEQRGKRLGIELVRDEVEDELTTELALTSEIRDQFLNMLKNVENQTIENRTSKQNLEYDWSEKRRAHEIETNVALLNCKSRTALHRDGIVTFQNDQSTMDMWNKFVNNLLEKAEDVRLKSEELRCDLNSVLMNAARDLRVQANNVDLALARRVACTQGMQQELTIELKKVLARLVRAEEVMPLLKSNILRLNLPLKIAQTRLEARCHRPRIESVRDAPQYGLVEEIRTINESISELRARYDELERNHHDLVTKRNELEREILLKKNTLELDGKLLKEIRSHYPSTNHLSGYID